MKFAAIADWADSEEHDVTFLCDQLGVSTSGYYKWRNSGPTARQRADERLTSLIRSIHHRLAGNPGVRRVHAELQALGERVAPKRVWRLMRAAGLQGRHPKAWKRTTVPGERPVSAPDLLERDFTAHSTYSPPHRAGHHWGKPPGPPRDNSGPPRLAAARPAGLAAARPAVSEALGTAWHQRPPAVVGACARLEPVICM